MLREDLTIGGAVIGVLLYAVNSYTELPVVRMSTSTEQCVEVVPDGSCDRLPSKYIVEWVQ